jgi:hypothetical protein
MNRTMVLSAAAILALVVGGTASAQTKILNCYDATGKVIACPSNYGKSPAPPPAGSIYQAKSKTKIGNGTPSKAPTQEQVVVVGVGPEPESILPAPAAPARASRPGLGGDWVPITAVDRLDKLQQWQAEFLGEPAPIETGATGLPQ